MNNVDLVNTFMNDVQSTTPQKVLYIHSNA